MLNEFTCIIIHLACIIIHLNSAFLQEWLSIENKKKKFYREPKEKKYIQLPFDEVTYLLADCPRKIFYNNCMFCTDIKHWR